MPFRPPLAFFLSLLASFTAVHAAPPADACLRALETQTQCADVAAGPARRLFSCPERKAALRLLGIERMSLRERFATIASEHEAVRAAIQLVAEAKALKPREKAIYWEELSAIIQESIGHAVSKSFLGELHGQRSYLFQGIKRFDGKVYWLVILADGRVLTGRANPLEDLAAWSIELGTLEEL